MALINDGCGIHLLLAVPEAWPKKLEPMQICALINYGINGKIQNWSYKSSFHISTILCACAICGD